MAKDAGDLVKKLASMEIDAGFGVTEATIKKYGKGAKILLPKPHINGREFGYGASIGLRKSDIALKSKIDEALKKLISDATVKTLSEKWFNDDMTP